jgi:PAS domain S-box-containing protein
MVNVPEGQQVPMPSAQQTKVLASPHDAIIGLTRLGVITGWNAAATLLYGYPAEEIVGRTMNLLIAPGGRAEAADILRRVVNGGLAERYDTERIGKDGSAIPVSVTTSAIVATAGVVVGALIVSRRLDEPLDAQEGLNEYVGEGRLQANVDKKELLRAHPQQLQRVEVLGQRAGGAAHEINNLLSVILHYATFVHEELIADSASHWERRRHVALRDVGQIQQAAERAIDLTHQILAFARQEVVRPRFLNLNDAVSDVEALLRRTIGEDIELVTNLPDNVWPILTDPGQVEQVLVNLAINARDAMPGGGTLRIDTANVEGDSVAEGSPSQPRRYVRLRVNDTGTGMPADIIAHAFEPFFTTKTHGAGMGLGLAVVYGIVTQADATITIHSEPGAGTTFTIMFPATDQTPVAVRDAPALPHLVGRQKRNQRG